MLILGCLTLSWPEIREGLFFEHENGRILFRTEQIESLHPVNLCDILDNLPGIILARTTLGGTLSDIKQPGRELYLDDKPVCLEVDGVELRSINADRTYLNSIPVKSVDSIVVDQDGGGLTGSRLRIQIYTKQDHINNAVTNVYWEQGPFDFNAVKFALSRRLGTETGFFIGMEKNYQAEGMGLYSGGPNQYAHPIAIVDIYRTVLSRPDSLYVDQGNLLESYSRLWNIQLNNRSVPHLKLAAKYTFFRDLQDDFRENPGTYGSTWQNFSTRQDFDHFVLSYRSDSLGPYNIEGQTYTYSRRVAWPISPDSSGSDSTFFKQGVDVTGTCLNVSRTAQAFSSSLLLEYANDQIHTATGVRTEPHTYAEACVRMNLDSLSKIPILISANSIFRQTLGTPSSGLGIFSSHFDNRLQLFANFRYEQRQPDEAARLLDNPKLNYSPAPSKTRTIISDITTLGMSFETPRFGIGYTFSRTFTRHPAVLQYLNTGTGWQWTQSAIRFEQFLEHEVFGELKLSYLSEYAGLHITTMEYARENGISQDPFSTFNLVNRLVLHRNFMHDRLFGKLSFITHIRPGVWAIEYYRPDAGPAVLNSYIDFDINIEFKIKTFSFITRFENLGNQVISYEPGYFLPGPLIRWGVDWTFGD